jgi:hypothetical protein
VSKNIKKSIKLRKLKNISKKPNHEKKPIKPIRIKKNRLVRFYKYETKKIESNPNQKNRAKQEKTGFCSKITEPNRKKSV